MANEISSSVPTETLPNGSHPEVRASVGFSKSWMRFPKLRLFPATWTEETERRKVILQHAILPSIFRCWVHFLPILAVIALIALNCMSYMVGPSYLGKTSQLYQTLDVLGLQVAAKILELLIGASLSLIVMDILRSMLLNNGLPLGLIDARLKLANISYFWSKEFIGSQYGLRGPFERWALPSFLVICGVIMLLAGPSSAVLVIPTLRDDWLVGRARFWQLGNFSRHFPDRMDGSILSSQCMSPSPENLTFPRLNFQECPWGGYSSLYNAWQERAELPNQAGFVLDVWDNTAARKIVVKPRGLHDSGDTWAIASDVAISIWSEFLRSIVDKLQGQAVDKDRASGVYGKVSSSARNLYAERANSTARVEAPIPFAGARCSYNYQTSWNRTTFSFPLISLYSDTADEKLTYFNVSIPSPDASANVSYVTANWVDIPEGATVTFKDYPAGVAGVKAPNPTVIGSTSEYPSALLNIRVPYSKDPEYLLHQQMFSCSIAAKWAPGHHVKSNVLSQIGYHYPELNIGQDVPYIVARYSLDPKEVGSWRTVTFDREWLETLAPVVDPEHYPYQRSIAHIFQNGQANDALDTRNTNWDEVSLWLENMLATVMVDGMSRVGLQRNSWTNLHKDSSLTAANFSLSQFEKGWTEVPSTEDVESWDKVPFEWTLNASGLVYSANSTATRLALALLSTYLAIALVHIIWTVARRYASNSWNSTSETLALFQNSPPAPYRLKNTSAGIKSLRTMSRRARIRALPSGYTGPIHEEVCVLFDEQDEKTIGYERIHACEKYGSVGGIQRAPVI